MSTANKCLAVYIIMCLWCEQDRNVWVEVYIMSLPPNIPALFMNDTTHTHTKELKI